MNQVEKIELNYFVKLKNISGEKFKNSFYIQNKYGWNTIKDNVCYCILSVCVSNKYGLNTIKDNVCYCILSVCLSNKYGWNTIKDNVCYCILSVCLSNECGDCWTMMVGSIQMNVSPKG